MKIIVIIPAFNEEVFIEKTLDSFVNQTYKNFKLVLVNDGSTDKTLQIAETYLNKLNDFSIVSNTKKDEHQPGAKIVKAFYKGLNSFNINDFDLISKLDADIILPENYLEKIVESFKNNPKVGMAGGHIYIQKNDKWIYENVANKKHIRGALKTYRKECFIQIGGIKQVLGWDNLDELLAIKNGWEIQTIESLKVKLLKETGFVYKNTKARKLGEYFYNLGLDFLMAFISCLKAGYTNKSLNIFFISYITYCKLVIYKAPISINKQEKSFIRKYRWKIFFKNMFS